MLDKLFTEATKAHSANELDVAENLYLKILNKYPKESKTLFLIGSLYIQKKIYKKAIDFLSEALLFDSHNDHILMNLGIAYKENRNFKDSEKMLTASLRINPNNADCLNNLGNLYSENLQYELAIKYFNKAIAINNNDGYLINLAEALSHTGEFKKSIEYLLKIKSCSKLFFESQIKLFNIFLKSRNYENSILLGEELLKKQLSKECLSPILHNLIHASLELGNLKKAKSFFLKLSSDDGNYLFNRAQIYAADGAINDAISQYNILIKSKKNVTQSLHNLGLLHSRNCNFNEAINIFKKALKINPKLMETRKVLGILQLSQCNFKLGWPNFLSYTHNPIYNHSFLKNKSVWDGKKVTKPILIILDQGIGDQIFYASLLTRLDQSYQYICMVDGRLKKLFKNSFANNIKFIEPNEIASVNFDFYIRGAHLAQLFITQKSDLDFQKPYLMAKKSSFKEKKIIGISWYSSNKFIGQQKSIKLNDLMRKLKHKTTSFMNLQYGDFQKEIKKITTNEKINFLDSSKIDSSQDIMDLAELVMACDEVYTISNSTAHLAAALGIKVHLLLPYNHHANTWYWFNDSDKKSLWYPNVQIFEAELGADISNCLNLIK